MFTRTVEKAPSDISVETLVATLPSFFQFLLQGTLFIYDPVVRGTIAAGLTAGTLSAATDGSLLPSSKRGGTNGVVLCPSDDPDYVISSAAPIPTSHLSTSLTAEHYRLITLSIIFHIITVTELPTAREQGDNCPKIAPVQVYIDNQETVKRGNRIKSSRLTLKEHSVPDYDLWELSNGLLQALPFKLNCECVKGHQDDDCAVVDLDLPA